jgi:hypothetical protein
MCDCVVWTKSPKASQLWATLASQHDGKDRWYLEALGIGAEDNWDACFSAYLSQNQNPANSASGKDIIWRSRSNQSVKLLASLATDPSIALKERLRYFRAFDFVKGSEKSSALLGMLNGNSQEQNQINRLALGHLDAEFVKTSPIAKNALVQLMNNLDDKEFVQLQDKYTLPEGNERLISMIGKGEKVGDAGMLYSNLHKGSIG